MKKCRPSWSTMVPVCARPVSPVMMLPEPCSLPLLDAQNIQESWSAWTKKM